MAFLPASIDTAMQNSITGALDFLRFQDTNLTASDYVDYGIGPTWHIVASGDFNGDARADLLAQQQA